MNHPEQLSLPTSDDQTLLLRTVAAVQAAGHAVKALFDPHARPQTLQEIASTIEANDRVSMSILRQALSQARPGARWDDDEEGRGPLPDGEWWVCDPVEGAIHHIHGSPRWGVTATLVRDNVPVLTAIHLPLTGDTYTALRGGGAWLNGTALKASSKSDLRAAMVGTGQAAPGEGAAVYRRIGGSVSAMLEAALVVHVSVPSTMQLIDVAAGRQDLFWQYSQVRSGLVAGALLVAEAGGRVTDLHGRPWQPDSRGFLAGAPALTAPAAAILAACDEEAGQ
ncbi:3'(2'),5'-bisphosphate nucleotidase CysQ [Massilia antarctica]|uniref:3'(2'),5'-bisphosphate nucleotidase CysQ n=1 Tax=Massilia antarctica TaxID=2765360 RepID=A0AA48WBZ4_9BURK|nr:inositol monophosphatase family protein [Massilia antarctica]QPI48719.1 3'(2'),5'-bisphosphate nucleotidase CysQ [Massilia antarctica]